MGMQTRSELVSEPIQILVVDDEDVVRLVFEALLSNTGYRVAFAATAEEALRAIEQVAFHLVIVDKNLPGRSGLELIRWARPIRPEAQFIVMTGWATYDSAIEALRLGAYDYLEKPFDDLLLVREKVAEAVNYQQRAGSAARLTGLLVQALAKLEARSGERDAGLIEVERLLREGMGRLNPHLPRSNSPVG